MAYNWDDFKTAGNFVKFEDVGDQITGDVVSVRTGSDYNGNPCPELLIRTDDGEEHTLSAGQALLKSELASQAPQVGDKLFVKFIGHKTLTNGRQAKEFQVAVKTGAGNVEPQAFSTQAIRDEMNKRASARAGGPVPDSEIPF